MTTFREIVKEKKENMPDKIRAEDYCCSQFKDDFLNEALQFNINFEDKYLDIHVNDFRGITTFVFHFVRNCNHCGTSFIFVGKPKEFIVDNKPKLV